MAETRLPGLYVKSGSIPTTALSGGVVSSSQQVIQSLPGGTVSSSQQVGTLIPDGTVSSSQQVKTLLPDGTISSSAQINVVLDLDNVVSSSGQVKDLLPIGTVTSSAQYQGWVTASSQIDITSTTGYSTFSSSIATKNDIQDVSITALNAATSSYAINSTIQSQLAGVASSSTQVKAYLPDGTVSSSAQYPGLVTASSQIQLSDVTGHIFGPNDYTFSKNLNVGTATLDKLSVTGSINVLGGTISGNLALPQDTVSSSVQVKAFLPNGTVSASNQIDYNSIQNKLSDVVSSSTQVQPLLPNGTVSASNQIDYNSITNKLSNVVSSSTQVKPLLPDGTVTSSAQYPGWVTASSQIDYNSITNKLSGTVSSSTQVKPLLPDGTVSSSAQYPGWVTASSQIDYNSIQNKLSGVVSSSTQVQPLLPAGTVSASNQIDYNSIQNKLSGTVSSSTQIKPLLPDGSVSSSTQIDYNNIQNKLSAVVSSSAQVQPLLPNGTVSASAQYPGWVTASSQIDYNNVQNKLSGVVSSSTQVQPLLPGGTVSSSAQYPGWVTASSQVDITATTGYNTFSSSIATKNNTQDVSINALNAATSSYAINSTIQSQLAGVASSSTQVKAYLPNGTVSASAQYPGWVTSSNQILLNSITGTTFSNSAFYFPSDLRVEGNLTAQQIYTEYVSSSVIYESGSTKFGDTSDDVMSVTGSVLVLGGRISGSVVGMFSSSTQIDYNNIQNKLSGVVSSSTQVQPLLPNGTVSSSAQYPGWVTASSQIDYNSITNKLSGVVSSSTQVQPLLPNGTVSSSVQVDYNSITNKLSGVVSSSTQIKPLLPDGTVSSSLQINTGSFSGSITTASYVLPSGLPVGSVSASSQIDYNSIQNKLNGVVSSSTQVQPLLPNGTVSSSTQYPGWVTSSTQIDYNNIQNKLSGVVSSSTQIKPLLPDGTVTSSAQYPGWVTSSAQINTGSFSGSITTASYVIPSGLPTGTVSASSQIDYNNIQNKLSGVVSSSTQVQPLLPGGTVSSSAQYPGWVTASSQIDYNSIQNKLNGVVSSSAQIKPLLPDGTVSSSIQINTGSFSGSFTGVHNGIFTGSILANNNVVSSSAQVIAFLPNGTVSSSTQYPGWVTASSQIDYNSIQNKLSGVVSSSTQVQPLLPAGTVSSSGQVDYNNIQNKLSGVVSSSTQVQPLLPGGTVSSSAQYPGWVTASSQIDYNQIQNKLSGVISSSTQFNALSGTSASYALTASFALATSGVVQNAVTASYAVTSSYVSAVGIVSSSSQIDYNSIQNKLSGVVSSSVQVKPLLPDGTVSSSAQYPGWVTASSQIDVRNTTGIATIATTGSNTLTGIQTISNTTNSTGFNNGALIVQGGIGVTKDVNISGSLTVSGLLTAVSTSVQYVTSSQLNVADNKIVVNTNDLVRFGGLSIVDSGSASPTTASIYWDSLAHNFIYENLSGSSYNSAIFIAGPKNTGTIGNEVGLTTNRIPVAVDSDHIDSRPVSSSMRVDFPSRLTHVEAGLFVTGNLTANGTVILQGIPSSSTQITALLPSDTVSSSTQVKVFLPNGTVSASAQYPGWVTASSQIDYNSIQNKLSGVVSSSTQVQPLLPANTVSSSTQVTAFLPVGTISSSTQFKTLSDPFTGSFTGSHTGTFPYSGLTNTPSGIVSSSTQVQPLLPAGSVSSSAQYPGWVTSSAQIDYNNIQNKLSGVVSSSTQVQPLLPAGTVSSSVQVDYNSITNKLSGVVSSSTQIQPLLPAGTISSSGQVDYNSITNKLSGVYSSSTQAVAAIANQTIVPTNVNATNILSGSVLQTGTNALIGGKLAVTGSAEFTGTITASNLTANQAVFTNAVDGLVSNAITGTGNVVMSANPTLTGTITADSITATGTIRLAGIVSQSSQIDYNNIQNKLSGVVSSSTQVQPLLPAGTVSSSGQVDYNSIQNKLSGVVSSSAQVKPLLPDGTVSSSTQQIVSAYTNATNDRVLTSTGAGGINGESALTFDGTVLSITTNGAKYFQGGDDAALYDVNVSNTLGIHGQQDSTVGAIKLGSSGQTIYSNATGIGIGTITPGALLHVQGNVSGAAFVGTSFTGTSFTGSFSGTHTGTFPYASLTGIPSGIVSSSTQVATLLPASTVSSSTASSPSQGTVRVTINGVNTDVDTGLQTGDSPTFSGLTSTGTVLLAGIYSSSGQVTISSTTGYSTFSSSIATKNDLQDVSISALNAATSSYAINSTIQTQLAGVVSSSAQVKPLLPGGTVTSSAQYPGWVTASSQVQLNSITGVTFSNSAFYFPSDLRVEGNLTAQQIYTEFVSSSVIYESGSTKFGDTNDDIMSVTGSIRVLGGNISGSFIGLVSQSAQIDYNSITNKLSGVVSSSTQVQPLLPNGTISSSAQYPGWITASSQIVWSSVNYNAGIVSSSTASSPSQGTVRVTINGANTDVDTGLQVGDSPTFAGLTSTGTVLLAGIYSSSAQTVTAIANQTIAPTTVNATTINASVVTASGLTANQAVFTNASDGLVSNAITGTGNVVMSASPTLTGTITAQNITATGTMLLAGIYSSSTQVDYNNIQNKLSGVVSSSTQVQPLLPAGTVSSSTASSPSQGTVRVTINGANTDVDTGLQSGDSPTFAGLTSTGTVLLAGIYSSSGQVTISSTTGYSTFSSSIATKNDLQDISINALNAATSSYAINSTIQSQLAGVVSSSAQVKIFLPNGTVSASAQYPGWVTASSQIDYNSITNKLSGVVSSSTQVATLLPASTVSSSTASSPSQGTVRVTINGTNTDVDTGLQTGDSPTFAGLTVDTNTLYVDATNDRVGIGTTSPTRTLTVNGSTNITGSLDVTGAFTAQTKSFKINHQTIPNKSLVYGVLEGPEHAVYVRGRLTNNNTIILPAEWDWLIDPSSITVQLTPIGSHQKLYVDTIVNNVIFIKNENLINKDIDCFYLVHATRKDVEPLQTVQ